MRPTFSGNPSDGRRYGIMSSMKNPGTAAVLSALLPGLGQIYNGDFLRGIFWLIVTPGLWIGSGGMLGWICHIISAMTAYSRARKKNRAYPPGPKQLA
jgi:TM2 domain-containing membrane protein YozV